MNKVVKEEYLKNPCRSLATAFWKSEVFSPPEGIEVVHQSQYKEGEVLERYFRLICFPKESMDREAEGFYFQQAKLPQDFALIANVINRCYGYNYCAEDIEEWTKFPVFDGGLWVFLYDQKTGNPAALGIADFDKEMLEGSLEWIQVLPEYQGRGLGERIVKELLHRLKKANFVTVSGQVDNKTKPEKLYRKCGFSGDDVWLVIRKKQIRI